MSVEAISWAFSQPIKHSTAKFVLVAMANHADGDMMCWPSTAHLCAQTSQDRKTVQANIQRLREMGYIEDTGERKGTTKQVIVYHLKTPEIGPVSNQPDDENLDTNTPEIGPVEEAQKRNSSENGTGPFFPSKRPVFPGKEAQISHERGPKTGHGTIKEPSRNHKGTSNTHSDPEFDPMEELKKIGVSDQTAKDWLKVRKAKRAPLTRTALDDLADEARKAGITTAEAVAICAKRTWQSMRADWLKDKPLAKGHSTEDQRRAENEEAYRLLYGKKPSEVIDV